MFESALITLLALKVSLERRSSRSALRSPSRDSQGLPGAGLISVLRAEPGLGPDDTTRKSTETCESSSLPLLNPPSRQLTNQGSQCDHTRDISMRINLVSDRDFFQMPPKRLAETVKREGRKREHPGTLDVYTLPLKEEFMNVEGCKRFVFGKDHFKQNRTIMVLGATGAGKSTLVNGMINYILGVTWDDTFRFKLVDEGPAKSLAHSQTSEVTVYKLNHREGFKIDCSLTIVDTPGFGDTRGIERDNMITSQLKSLFSAKLGVSEIDVICFVAQASLPRLTATQKYVFDSVLSIFGKDVAENIQILVTFAYGQKSPVLEAINQSGVPCPKRPDGSPIHFKFNNSALFADNKSLTLTKEVLKKRGELETAIENLQIKGKLGLAKLEGINQESKILITHRAVITANVKFEYEVSYLKPVQEKISDTGNYITNCQQCQRTCHYPCGIPNDADKNCCVAIGPDGNCQQCDNKCHWSVHFNQKYRWVYEQVTEKRTFNDLKEKYKMAYKEAMSVEDIIKQMELEYDLLQDEVVQLMDRSAECLNILKFIALKPNPLSTPEYIDLLIQREKSEAMPGNLERINKLQHMKEKAVAMGKAADVNKLL
ncbi:unnamed protein product [Boreogadus saida]